MNKLLLNFSLLLFCMGLVLAGCSSNTQSENTGIGAVTGAVVGGAAGSFVGQGAGRAVAVGVGAIAGALLGGYIGHNMDSTDTANANNAMSNNEENEPTTWHNKKTGSRYTVAPTSKMMTVNGNPHCRRYYSTAYEDGEKRKISGIACRQPNGMWEVMKDR